MHVGIDLGTTFCCVAYVDDDGRARVIPNNDGDRTTPSVVWFDGRQAVVGRRANERKLSVGANIIEFVKRDVGKPVELTPDDPPGIEAAPYEYGNFKYGAAGISAIILRKLKRDAFTWLQRQGKIARDLKEKDTRLDAVITVPAYFGDRERRETALAGWAAGLNVIGMVEEPTAAAIAYSIERPANKRILVFDLGGGTLDVTILQMRAEGDAHVLSKIGNNQLGGRDWDALIERYLEEAFRQQNGFALTDDPAVRFELQRLALDAKLALSDEPQTEVLYSLGGGELQTTLHRDAPPDRDMDFDMDAADDGFYFDERSADLLSRCQSIVEGSFHTRAADGTPRTLAWADVDEIVLAGGSCRMPMIPALLERVANRKVRRTIEGFDYDTAIAVGAALYGLHRSRIRDVAAHGLGVKVITASGRAAVDYLIHKDAPLPASASRTYRAPAAAYLEVYEGEATVPDEATRRGTLHLDNPPGHATITFDLDAEGLLRATATYPVAPDGTPLPGVAPTTRALDVHHEGYLNDARAATLRDRIQSLTVN